ncbi:MAG: hypothetical protein EPO10_30215 [Reyranella sp.]|uniref:hypothetical protein n=1 Tax=Reyranella sp. TaxID=1929291 RepID=UPI001203E1A9|nr:hypothetical protein [Reyranella sp.]TAJ85729.1 MAG: hypothetical protein EPO41_25890 [Reyranella sp.]TBR21229.1 MAG: hypothetical protein EPO10_30215 [Reyranella sp.]
MMNPQRLALSIITTLAAVAMAACHDQQTIEGTSSRTLNVAGKRMKANLSPTGTPNEFDLLIVRDAIVIDPDPASERARGEEAATRVTREVCKVRSLNPQIVSERMADEINYYVRFRCV